MITTVTLNASIDKAYYMQGSIQNGEVMRVKEVRNSAGGKGLNVARTAKLCGEQVVATGMTGGFNGAYLESLLTKDGVEHQFAHIQGETRSCINILDETYGSTEYLEPGCEVTEEEEKEFLEQVFPEVTKNSDVVTISGSIPKGMDRDIYVKMIRQMKEQGKQVLLDTSGDLLKRGIAACPTMIKPNKDEIEMLFDTKVEKPEDVRRYANRLHEQGIDYVVISLGGDGAMLVCEEGVFQAKPPKPEAVNTVGCGDSMVGAFAVALTRKYPVRKALTFAVAVSAANALSPNTGDFKQENFERIIEHVELIEL